MCVSVHDMQYTMPPQHCIDRISPANIEREALEDFFLRMTYNSNVQVGILMRCLDISPCGVRFFI